MDKNIDSYSFYGILLK